MQACILLVTVSAGLCATLTATPLNPEPRPLPDIVENSAATIQTDLRLASTLATTSESSIVPQMFEPIVTFDGSLDGPIPRRAAEISDSVDVPEPTPFVIVIFGSAAIAIFGMRQLNWDRKPHARRHRMQVRALTALR